MAPSSRVRGRETRSPRGLLYAAIGVAVVVLVALSALEVLPSAGAPPGEQLSRLGRPPASDASHGEEGLGRRPPVSLKSHAVPSAPLPVPTTAPPSSAPPVAPPVVPPKSAAPDPTGTMPQQWQIADGPGPVLGGAPTPSRFQLAVETGLLVAPAAFAKVVDDTLGDPGSWIADRGVGFQRVGPGTGYDFTIFLASPDTAYELCAAGGVDIREFGSRYTSCRVGDSVVINADRYLLGIPAYRDHLPEYRQYVINHEVGHWLGHGHERCPGAGQPAPVMQQQTLDMQGCTRNSWPYIDGKRYEGPPSDAQ